MVSATIGLIVSEVCTAMWTALKDTFVAFPNEDQWKHIQKGFFYLWNYLNCVGAIDGNKY